MRMANERDQNIIRSAGSDAAASLLVLLPSLGTREVFAFGEGVALPTRRRFNELPAHMIARSESELSVRIDSNRGVDSALIHSVVERWPARPWATRASSATPPPSPASRQGSGGRS